jgi:predicted DNA binding CopG/RHH family protein
MRKEYDFSSSVRNPYPAKLKKQITIRLDENVLDYFKSLASEFDIPYQNLINLYLRDCTSEKRKPRLKWKASTNRPVQKPRSVKS